MADRTYELDTDEALFKLIEKERKPVLKLIYRARREGWNVVYLAKRIARQSYQQFPTPEQVILNLDRGVRTKRFIVTTDRRVLESVNVGDVFEQKLRYS